MDTKPMDIIDRLAEFEVQEPVIELAIVEIKRLRVMLKRIETGSGFWFDDWDIIKCTYCYLPVKPSEIALGDNDVWQHSDIKFCAEALKRRVAELEADTIRASELCNKACELCEQELNRRVAELESALADERSYAATLEDRLELYTGNASVVQTAED